MPTKIEAAETLRERTAVAVAARAEVARLVTLNAAAITAWKTAVRAHGESWEMKQHNLRALDDVLQDPDSEEKAADYIAIGRLGGAMEAASSALSTARHAARQAGAAAILAAEALGAAEWRERNLPRPSIMGGIIG